MTQKQAIVDWLTNCGSLTTMEAFLSLGITKLPTRVGELRKDGYPISSEKVTAKDRRGKKINYFRYYITKENEDNGRH